MFKVIIFFLFSSYLTDIVLHKELFIAFLVMNYFLPDSFSSENMPAIINDPPKREMSFNSAIIVTVLSVSLKRCGICIVTIKRKSNEASIMVENFTNFFMIILILATISIIPVRIIVYAPNGIKEVNIPM